MNINDLKKIAVLGTCGSIRGTFCLLTLHVSQKQTKKRFTSVFFHPVLTERSQPLTISHVMSEEETQHWFGLHVIPEQTLQKQL